jgi:hypothetical protein
MSITACQLVSPFISAVNDGYFINFIPRATRSGFVLVGLVHQTIKIVTDAIFQTDIYQDKCKSTFHAAAPFYKSSTFLVPITYFFIKIV